MFCLTGGALIVSVVRTSHGSTPASGTVSEASPKVTWSGPVKAPTGSADCATANNAACDNYRLTIQPPSAGYGPYLVEIKLQPELAGDWDMQVYGPGGKLVDGSGNSPGQTELVVLINPPAGTYTVAAAPFAPLTAANGNSYTATAEIKKHTQNPAAPGADNNISYHNFVAPGSLGNSAGEPTIGVNWKTGKVMYIAGLQTLRVTFDDSAVPAKATWENKSAIFTGVITMDPILFTNPHTGRTIVSQLVTPAAANGLAVLTDGCSISGYTDDDGETWIIDQGCGLPSGADHQSVGGGPFAAPLPGKLPLPDQASGYSQATYYCAQSGVTAYCSRSDDGGVTYGPGVPVYTTECGGLHGHPMVAPDGTVYLPNKACGGKQGVTVSEDNGLTWTVRTVPDSLPAANDPGVGVGANGTVYFGYQNGDGTPRVAVSRDKGRTWTPGVDVGTAYGIKNTVFPRVVAGDDDRAAFSFLGTPTAGPFQDAGFTGEWHLYISHTFDGGKTWSTIDATPTDPVQRGCIWMQGGSNPCRNLLDFMGSAVDKQGRVLVGYADGCIGCADPSSSRAKKATIARQVNGRRLFAAHDPTATPTPTPTPTATPTPSPTPNEYGPKTLHFHGNPTDDSGCTGAGAPDIIGCDGPSLLAKEVLGTGAPGHWDVPDPAVDGTADRNLYDPNWIWHLDRPTTLGGAMTIKWWASCGACGPTGGADWNIRLWADGTKVFEQLVHTQPALPNVPVLLTATVTLPTVSASSTFVLHIDPVFLDSQANTHIYYDSQSACPGVTGSAPCDSQVVMPVVNPNATPTPTATVTPTPTPTATVTPTPTATPTPASGIPRYANYVPPAGIADDWGEPSVGANWQTGKILSYGGFGTYMLRMSFDDATSPARVTWERMPLLIAGTPRAFGDPILFTDRVTGRTFVSQLVGLTPFNGMDFTDDDGQFFQPSQGSGIASGIDHQTVGGGPFHEPVPTGAAYPHAVYYCAQEGLNFSGNGIANCALSVDGGRTFGPAVPVYASNLVNSCSPLHGHLKVAPDGTAYLPNKKCGDGAGMTYTEDNGVTWKAATVPNSTVGDSDASVGIATDGTVYIGYEGADGRAYAAVFNPQTKTFGQPKDVGAQAGVQNAIFPAVVAGDPGRAAFAFYGSSSPGDQDSPDYRGVWHLYVASTFDGGQTWTTVNATPGDPIQRDGICTRGFQGCTVPRNLLDFFDATVDKEGRVIVGYNDGCMGPCVQAGPNSNTSKGVIARQSGGKRLFAQYDPPEPALPAAPLASATRDSGGVVHLSWPAPDNGGSAITSYKVYRRTDATSFALLATVPETGFDDRTAAANTSYTYRVSAVNAQGEGPASPDVKPVAGPSESPCEEPGITVANDTLDDGSDADAPQQVPPDARVNIRKLSVAEPYFEDGSSKLVFTLRMAPSAFASAPPLSQWYIIWNRRTPALDGSDRMYVAMRSDAESKISFEYGNFGPVLPLDGTVPPPNANVPTRLGDVDSSSYDPLTGLIRITLSTSKAEGVAAGQLLVDLNARTFFARPEVGPRSQNVASDITGNGTYTLVGNASCKVNGAPTAVLTASPQAGFAPLVVNFDASGSFDRDGGDRVASYTFDFGDGSPELTQNSPAVSHTYGAAGNYFAKLTVTDSQGERSNNIATAAVEVRELPPPVVETIEDNDARVAYSDAWHLVSDANASAGHFRYHTGKGPSHSATLSFDVAQGKTGAVTYHFARSPKGGTADIYLDGAFQRTVNYAGGAGSTQKPEFAAGHRETFAGLAAGAHRLEIRNLNGVVYLDRFVLESSTSSARPAAGPGATTNQQGSVGGGSTSSSNYTMQPGAQGVSVVAESSLNLPFRLVLVDPSGLALATADAANGIATISRPVTQGGVYVIKVVNLSVGQLQITTTTTPLVKR